MNLPDIGSTNAAAIDDEKADDMSARDNNLGRKLAILAKLRGLTQEQIAKECSISRISVNRFFRCHTEIRAGDLATLLQILGIDINKVIDIEIDKAMRGQI